MTPSSAASNVSLPILAVLLHPRRLEPSTQHKLCLVKQSPLVPKVLTPLPTKHSSPICITSYSSRLLTKRKPPTITHRETPHFGPIPSCGIQLPHPKWQPLVLIPRSILAWGPDADCSLWELRQGRLWAEKEMSRTDSGTNIQASFSWEFFTLKEYSAFRKNW